MFDKKPQRYAKDNTTAHLTARSDKSVAYVTNNKRLYLTFCTVEAYYWHTRSIARPLCDSRATCCCQGNCTQAISGTISNDLEWPLTQLSRSCHYLTLSISEMVQDVDKVTMNRNLHMPCSRMSFWMTLNDPEWLKWNIEREALCSLSAAAELLVLESTVDFGEVTYWNV